VRVAHWPWQAEKEASALSKHATDFGTFDTVSKAVRANVLVDAFAVP
jgi:hypothetical protein